MTTLAAYQGEGWATIGCDSRATDEVGNIMDLATPKILENGPYLIAVAGSSRGGNILQYGWSPPKPPSSNNLLVLDKFVTGKLIPAIRKVFIDSGFDMKDDGAVAMTDSVFLIAFNGIVYWINSDYSWDRDVRGIYYHGSGGIAAAVAMTALNIDKCKDSKSAEKVIARAVDIATQWDVYSHGPIIVRSQHY